MAEVIDFDPYKDLPPVVRQFIGTPYEAKALRAYEEGRQEAIAKAKKAARNRAIGLAKIHFGEADGARFADLIESNLTESQYRNIRPQLESAGESEELKSLRLVISDIDRALSQPVDDGGFMTVVEETMAAKKIGKVKAMQMVAREQPRLHKRFIESRNSGKEI